MRPSLLLLLALLLPSSTALAGPEVDDDLVADLPVEARAQLNVLVEDLARIGEEQAQADLDQAKAERKAGNPEVLALEADAPQARGDAKAAYKLTKADLAAARLEQRRAEEVAASGTDLDIGPFQEENDQASAKLAALRAEIGEF